MCKPVVSGWDIFCEVEREVVGGEYNNLNIDVTKKLKTASGSVATPHVAQVGPATGAARTGLPGSVYSSPVRMGSTKILLEQLCRYPEQAYMIEDAHTNPDAAGAVLFSILALQSRQLSPDEIPHLRAFKDFATSGPLRPSIGQYIARWNSMEVGDAVEERDVLAVCSLVFNRPSTDVPGAAAASGGGRGGGGGADVAAAAATEEKLQRLIIALQRCNGKLRDAMIAFFS